MKNVHKIIFVCIVALVILAPALLRAKDTLVHSAAELSAALKSTQPGDTLTLANGVWLDQHLVFRTDGTETDTVLLRAETPGHVILTGTSTLRIAGNYLKVDGLRFVGGTSYSGAVIEFRSGGVWSSHSRLTNCAVVNYNPDSKTQEYKWVSLYGFHNRVDHCYFAGKTHLGATLVVWLSNQPNYHRIDHNHFGPRPPLGMNGGETIRIGTSDWSMYDSFTLVEWNYFEHCNGEIEIISSKSGGNLYRYNTFFECEGTLTLRHGNHNTVEGNFFFGNGNYRSGGVRIIGEDHKVFNNYFSGLNGDGYRSAVSLVNGVPNSPPNRYFQVKRAVVAFNTLVNCRRPFEIGAGKSDEQSLPPEDCVIANNVVQGGSPVVHFTDQPVNLRWEGNIFWGGSLGISPVEGIRWENPGLSLAADGLWRPGSTSPALDAAAGDYPFVTEDMDGQPRTGVKDVGADELSTAPVVRHPVGPQDTGPWWMKQAVPYFVAVRVSGKGAVQLSPPGGLYTAGTEVTAVARPDSGWRFVRWEGDLSSQEDTLAFTVSKDLFLTAVFEQALPERFTLQVYVFSSGGHVELSPAGGSYSPGTEVQLTAVADPGWRFVSWGGDLNGSQNPAVLVMDGNKTVFATFEQVSGVAENGKPPGTFQLLPNWPNPFRDRTVLEFSLPRAGRVRLVLYNLRGRQVAALLEKDFSAGWHRLAVGHASLPAGVYLCVLQAGHFRGVQKWIVLR